MTRRGWARTIAASLVVTALVAAVAVEVLRPKYLPGEGEAAPDESLVAQLRATVEALPSPRPVGSEPLARAEQLVAARFRASGYRVTEQGVNPDGVRSHNIIASVRSGMEFGDHWVIGAHLDTVRDSPGADDNGSGVAIMLAVAERLAGTRAASHVTFVAFADEERGMHGSNAWVRSLSEYERHRIDGVFVLDTVGFTRREPGSQGYPEPLGMLGPKVGDFAGCITLRRHGALLERFVEARERVAKALPLVTLATPVGIAERVPDLWRSDHAPLWRAEMPALLITDTGNFRNPHYHRPSDLPDTLDYVLMAQIAETLMEVVRSSVPVY